MQLAQAASPTRRLGRAGPWLLAVVLPPGLAALRLAVPALGGHDAPLTFGTLGVVLVAAVGGLAPALLACAVAWTALWAAGTSRAVLAGFPIEAALAAWVVARLRAGAVEARRTGALLDTLMTHAPVGIGFVDRALRFIRVNETVARIHGTAAAEHGGRSYPEVAPLLAPTLQARLDALLRQVLDTGRPATGVELSGQDASAPGDERYWVASFYRVEARGDAPPAIGFIAADISERRRTEAMLRRKNAVLAAIDAVLGRQVAASDPSVVHDQMLASLLELTASPYGFVATVHRDPAGGPYVRMRAISDLSWDDATRALYEANRGRDLEFRNLHTLFGAVVTSSAPVIANDPATDERRGGLPSGHPALSAFLGLPLLRGDTLVGVLGAANRPGGYDAALVDEIEPFAATCAQVLEARESDRLRREAETDREALLDSERRMRADAEEASRATHAFLAAASHELRTPIGPVIGWAQLLRDPALSDDERAMAIDVIERSGRMLARLVDDLLDASRLLEARRRSGGAEMPLPEAIAAAVEPVRVALDAKGLALDVLVRPDAASALEPLRHLVQSLLAQAVKAAEVGGRIGLTIERGGGALRLAVRETPPGAPSAEPAVGARPAAGTDPGIGFAVLRHLVESHGGTLRAEKGAGGRIVAWLVTLPDGDAAAARALEIEPGAAGRVSARG